MVEPSTDVIEPDNARPEALMPPNATSPALPENTSLVFVASAINVNLLVESSKPKKPIY